MKLQGSGWHQPGRVDGPVREPVVRAGRFVGRVGGLAVALGVGVAVASSPGVAWAEPTESDSPTTDAPASSPPGAPPSAPGTASLPAAANAAAKEWSRRFSMRVSASEPASRRSTNTAATASIGSTVTDDPRSGLAQSSGGTLSRAVVEPAVRRLSSNRSAVTPVRGNNSGSNARRQLAHIPAVAPPADTDKSSTVVSAAPSRNRISQPPHSVVHRATSQPVAPQAPPAITETGQPRLRTTPVTAQNVSAVHDEPAPLRYKASRFVSSLLGLASSTTDGPPADSPLALALAALGTRPRQYGRSPIDGFQSLSESSTLTSLGIDTFDTAGQQSLATAATNSAPVLASQPVGIPNPVNGVVTGTVIATDADGDALNYTVTGTPPVAPSTWATPKGTVTINQSTGAYTYTPTPSARLAAGTTASADTDTFTVAVSDGQTATTADVSVYVSPTQVDTKAPITVGTTPSAVVISTAPNDYRMYVANTGSNTVSVINTSTGQRIDANSSSSSMDISVSASPSALALSADGKRLYVANTGSGTVSVINTDTYKVIDTNTRSFGTQSISVGSSPSALLLNGTRLYVANRGSNTVSVIDTTTNAVVDVNPNASGTQSISVGASPNALALRGTQLYVSNSAGNSVSVINTSTNSVTTTIAVGSQPSGMALGADGRLFVANTGSGTVSVIDTATNTIIDTNPTAAAINSIPVGPSPTSVAFSPNGSLAYVANGNDTVSVIDTKDYTVLRTVAIDSDPTGGHVIAVSPNGTIYISDAVDRTVRILTITRGNTAPIAGTPTVDSTDTSTVSGALNVVDPDGDTLSYSLTQPSGGTVSFTGAGGYTFTPTPAARRAAANGGPLTTSFTVNVSDGKAATPVSVTVPISPSVGSPVATVINTVTLGGWTTGKSPLMTADGSRALVTTYPAPLFSTTRTSVIDTTTGTLIGTVNVPGALSSSLLSANGSRALITATPSGVNGNLSNSTRVAVINPSTGAQVGTTLSLTGNPAGSMLSADGTRALVATTNYDPNKSPANVTTWVTVVDTTTGRTTGTTFTVPGNAYGFQPLNADGTRVLVTTRVYDSVSRTYSTRVAVLNTSGTQTGSTLTLNLDNGYSGLPVLNADGSRAVLTDSTYGTPYTSRAVVIDTTTGKQLGSTIPLTGELSRAKPLLDAKGNRILLTTHVTNSGGAITSTRVAVVDLTTGTQIGNTLEIAGEAYPQLSSDGTRTVVTAYVPDTTSSINTTTNVAVLDNATGAQIGETLAITVPGYSSNSQPLVTTTKNKRAVIATATYNPAIVDNVTRVAVVDTTTGGKTGGTVIVTGEPSAALALNEDGSRVLITTRSYAAQTGVYTTRVAVIDTTAGAQIGDTLIFNAQQVDPPRLTVDGTRALITTRVYDPATGTYGLWVTEVDPTTGDQVGNASPLTQDPQDPQYSLLSADGTHALTITSAFPGDGTTRVAVVQIA
jgi:YVTN family beta-propeller protein/VCBS repeat-containing protein